MPPAYSISALLTPYGHQQREAPCLSSIVMPAQTTCAQTQAFTTLNSEMPVPFAETTVPTATMGIAGSQCKHQAGHEVLGLAKKVIDDSALYEPNSRTIDEVLFRADDFSKLFTPATTLYQGLLVSRPQNPSRFQSVADSLLDGALGNSQTVDLSPGNLDMRLAGAASALCSNLNLPQELSSTISTDVIRIGQTFARLLPQEPSLVVKLENIGHDNCPRWHQDYYVARAIVSYNGKGTEYTNDANVDFWELEHCGNNACILRDKSMTRHIGCGDILFMKGLRYPSAHNGLVHKSPALEYHATGDVKKRLALKVDVGHRQ